MAGLLFIGLCATLGALAGHTLVGLAVGLAVVLAATLAGPDA